MHKKRSDAGTGGPARARDRERARLVRRYPGALAPVVAALCDPIYKDIRKVSAQELRARVDWVIETWARLPELCSALPIDDPHVQGVRQALGAEARRLRYASAARAIERDLQARYGVDLDL